MRIRTGQDVQFEVLVDADGWARLQPLDQRAGYACAQVLHDSQDLILQEVRTSNATLRFPVANQLLPPGRYQVAYAKAAAGPVYRPQMGLSFYLAPRSRFPYFLCSKSWTFAESHAEKVPTPLSMSQQGVVTIEGDCAGCASTGSGVLLNSRGLAITTRSVLARARSVSKSEEVRVKWPSQGRKEPHLCVAPRIGSDLVLLAPRFDDHADLPFLGTLQDVPDRMLRQLRVVSASDNQPISAVRHMQPQLGSVGEYRCATCRDAQWEGAAVVDGRGHLLGIVQDVDATSGLMKVISLLSLHNWISELQVNGPSSIRGGLCSLSD